MFGKLIVILCSVRIIKHCIGLAVLFHCLFGGSTYKVSIYFIFIAVSLDYLDIRVKYTQFRVFV